MRTTKEFWLLIYEMADVIDDEIPCPGRVEEFVHSFSQLPFIVQIGVKKNCKLLAHVLSELDGQLNADSSPIRSVD